MSTPLQLSFDVPRRGKPPRHLIDLDPTARRAVVTELGEPAFRADQISRHVFGHFSDDPSTWTDVPERSRGPLATALLPPLVTPVRHIEKPPSTRRESAVTAADWTRIKSHYPADDPFIQLLTPTDASAARKRPVC